MTFETFFEIFKVLLEFLATLIWPSLILLLVLLFRKEIKALLVRLESAKIAGTEITLNKQAAVGYISDSVDSIATQSSREQRLLLAEKVKQTALIIGKIHPISLSILIRGVQQHIERDQPPVTFTWDYYMRERRYFDELEENELVRIQDYMDEEGMADVTLLLTQKGKSFLSALGGSSPLSDKKFRT